MTCFTWSCNSLTIPASPRWPGASTTWGLHNLPALGVRHPDHGAFLHRQVRQQRRLYLRSCDIVTRRQDHVVGAGGKVEISVLILPERVARQVPAIPHICVLAVVIQLAAAGRATHGKTAGLPARKFGHVIVDTLCLITGHRLAGAAGAMVVKAVGDEDMQRFTRADCRAQ